MGELYVADAHAFAYYLADTLPRKADEKFLSIVRGERRRLLWPAGGY